MYNILIKLPIVGKLVKMRESRKVTDNSICGKNLQTVRASHVSLQDGSTKEDVKIGDNVWMYGRIMSQNHGKVTMGSCTKIGLGSSIVCVDSVTIGDYTAIANNTLITDNNNHPVNPDYRLYMRMQPENDDSRKWKHSVHAPVLIGKNCWIGQNVRIQKGVTIGDNSVIAANSVVTKSVPANSIAAGNPAKIVKTDIDQIQAPTTCEGYNAYKAEQKQ